MTIAFRTIAAAGLGAALMLGGFAAGALAQSKEDAFKERVAAMKSMSDQAKIVAAFAKGDGSPTAAAEAGNKLAATAAKIPALFPPGSSERDGLAKSRAKADIWNDWPKFQAAAAKLKNESEAFAKAASAGDKTVVASSARGINEACASCHKPFRGAKK